MKEVHIGRVEKKLEGNTCPSCGRKADGGTSIDDVAAARIPKCGDYAAVFCDQREFDGRLKMYP